MHNLTTLRYRFDWLQRIESRFDADIRQQIKEERVRLLRQICRIQRELVAQGEPIPSPIPLEDELILEQRTLHTLR